MIQLDRHDDVRLGRAREVVRGLGSVLVAYSGGVDSSLLLRLAMDELGAERAVAVLASSPAYPDEEQEQARALARQLGARLVEVETHEVELDAYRRNLPDRCFHCKEELFDTLEPIRARLGLAHLAYGATADDEGDHRPGHGSAVRRGVRFPLLEAGMGKGERSQPPRLFRRPRQEPNDRGSTSRDQMVVDEAQNAGKEPVEIKWSEPRMYRCRDCGLEFDSESRVAVRRATCRPIAVRKRIDRRLEKLGRRCRK